MYLSRARSLLLVAFIVPIVAAGCGEGTLPSPTGPSASTELAPLNLDAPSDLAVASASDETLAALGGKESEKAKQEKEQEREQAKREKEREKEKAEREKERDRDDDDGEDGDRFGRRRNLSGFVSAVGTDSITIRGLVVKVTPTTVIRHGNRHMTLAHIKPGDHAQAKGLLSASGRTFTASEIKVEDTGNDNGEAEDDDEEGDHHGGVELKGAVAGLPASPPCPNLTFTIGTTAVKTDSATVFDDVTCATLANGNHVEVEGIRQTDGSILATKVERE